MIAGSFITLLVLVAVFAPLIAPDNPDYANILATNLGPAPRTLAGHGLLRTRPALAPDLRGAPQSARPGADHPLRHDRRDRALAIPPAWFGGWFDQFVSRVADILFAFPGLIFAMLAVAMFGPGLVAPVIALSIAYTPYLMRVIRAEAINSATCLTSRPVTSRDCPRARSSGDTSCPT